MSLRYPPLRLITAGVATREEQLAVRKRRGYWVQRARKRKGLTQQALAQLMGYTTDRPESVVSRWEKGERPIPSDKLEPLARHLSLPSNYLISPPLTDDERLDRAVREGSALERSDWDAAEERAREVVVEPVAARGRRSA